MKTTRFTCTPIAAVVGLTAFLTTGCPKKPVVAVLSDQVVSESQPQAVASQASLQEPSEAAIAAAPNRWIDIKEYTFDARARFYAGLEKLEAKVDEQIRELEAKRATMDSTVDTKAWDFAMKEMRNSRAYLQSTGEESKKATPETWNQWKEKIGRAWDRTQDAYSKVKASTTL